MKVAAKHFGIHVRTRREKLRASNPRYSLRQVAGRIDVEPSYLSKVERGDESPPSEATISSLAQDLGEDRDLLLALAGKVSIDVQRAILRRPQLFTRLIRELGALPDRDVQRIHRNVREGQW